MAPELAAGRHPEALARHEQAHGAIEETLVQLEHALLSGAEAEEPVVPVAGEGKRNPQPLQPGAGAQSRRCRDWQGKDCGQGRLPKWCWFRTAQGAAQANISVNRLSNLLLF